MTKVACFLQHSRGPNGSDVRIGPFDDIEDARRFADTTGMSWSIVPLIPPEKFSNTSKFWMEPYAFAGEGP